MPKKELNSRVIDCVKEVHTVVWKGQTVGEALETIRKQKIEEKIFYFYVVDEDHKLIGVATTRALLLNDPAKKIADIMDRRVICVSGNQTLKEALSIFEHHHLLALPVIDEQHRLVGVVDVQLYLEESVDIAQARKKSEIFQLIGIYLDEGKKISVWHSYKNRMPWIFCNMLGGVACAIISLLYEPVLAKVLLLAMFIPLVLSLSESISMQTMTLSLQMLHKHRISWIFKHIFSEWKVLAFLAATCGFIVGALSLLWEDGVRAGFTIGSSIVISVIVTGSIGLLVPVILHAKNWDPKLASGPIVLTCADVLTTLIYLSLASWFLL